MHPPQSQGAKHSLLLTEVGAWGEHGEHPKETKAGIWGRHSLNKKPTTHRLCHLTSATLSHRHRSYHFPLQTNPNHSTLTNTIPTHRPVDSQPKQPASQNTHKKHEKAAKSAKAHLGEEGVELRAVRGLRRVGARLVGGRLRGDELGAGVGEELVVHAQLAAAHAGDLLGVALAQLRVGR